MRFDPQDPICLTAIGSCSQRSRLDAALSVLHLTKTQAVNATTRAGTTLVTLDDIRRFRQLDCKAPVTPSTTGFGVETTTGPSDKARHERRMAIRSEVARHALQPA